LEDERTRDGDEKAEKKPEPAKGVEPKGGDGARGDEAKADAEADGAKPAAEGDDASRGDAKVDAAGDDGPEGAEGDATDDGAKADAAEAKDADGPYRASARKHVPITPVKRMYRTVYWLAWFILVPFVMAILLVWALTPASGIERGGAIGWIQSLVREQPVPVGIVLFTLFEMSLWAARHRLPLSSHAHPPLRHGVPAELRQPFERARVLLDEAHGILEKHGSSIKEELSTKERERLRVDLAALDEAMQREPFDVEAFTEALVRADGEVDIRLGRWRKSEVREYMESILIAIAVAMALRAFVIEAFKIPSGSMIPTLQVGDHIFVNKFSYGPAIPWTKTRIFSRMPPERGDVMVFAFPEHPEQDFIKRIVAIPGDELRTKGGRPVINGWEVPRCSVGTYSYTESELPQTRHEGDLFVEYLGDESYLTLYDNTSMGGLEERGPYHVKPGEVWVMGDNRNNSHDSRMWWGGQGGGVPFDNIRGRALFVWLSMGDAGVDWSRLGAPVMGRPRLPPSMKHLEAPLEKCLRERPPIEKTTPPPPKAAP
jgi:signal peptidase I